MTYYNRYTKPALGSKTDTDQPPYSTSQPMAPAPAPAPTAPAPSAPVAASDPSNRELKGKDVAARPTAGASGGGGASGKMLYRPKVSQSRIGALHAMLGLPYLKRPQ